MASTAVSTVPKAVITTTGNAALCRFTPCRNSKPFIPGSLRSVTTRSTVFSRRSFSPVSASPADSVLKPSSPRFNSSRRRIFASSSTIRMVGICLAIARCFLALLRCSLVARGEKDHEPGSPLTVAGILEANRSVVPVNNPGDDRQSQSHTGFLGGHKRVKDLFPQFHRNSRPRVFDPHLYSVTVHGVGSRHRDAQFSATAAHRIISILN